MSPRNRIRLLRQLEQLRHLEDEYFGIAMPKSAYTLLKMLEKTNNSDERYNLYYHLILEFQLAGRSDLEVRFSKARLKEFKDITSLMVYASALTSAGRVHQGLVESKRALDQAISERVLVNCAAVGYVREAIRAGRVESANDAIVSLLKSIKMPRSADSILELDWIDSAKSLGVSPSLLAKVQRLKISDWGSATS